MLHFRNQKNDQAVEAIRYDGTNAGSIGHFIAPIEVISRSVHAGGEIDLLIADPDFPMWLRRGEWIARDPITGELDVWADSVFVRTFLAAGARGV